MKKFLLLFLMPQFSILNSQFSFAQKETIDEKAKSILDELSKKTKAYTSVKADFSYTLDNPQEKINETQKGNLIVKGNKYKLSIAGQEITCDGKTMWTYMKDAGEVQIDNAPDPNKEDNSFSPTKIFTLYEKGFKYKFEKEETQNGKTMQVINLYPEKAKEKPYHTVKLFIDKNAKEISSVVVMNKDGNKYTYNLTKFESNVPLSDSDFTFDTSKAKDVIDLR